MARKGILIVNTLQCRCDCQITLDYDTTSQQTYDLTTVVETRRRLGLMPDLRHERAACRTLSLTLSSLYPGSASCSGPQQRSASLALLPISRPSRNSITIYVVEHPAPARLDAQTAAFSAGPARVALDGGTSMESGNQRRRIFRVAFEAPNCLFSRHEI